MKLGFIDGSFPKPAAGSKNLEKWKRVDLMITSWLWNSIAKEILGAYMYAASSRNLWLELQRRYGSSNGPMIYQIRRDISSVNQGNLSLTTYFTNLKQLWNEVTYLDPMPQCTCGGCTCGVNRAIANQNESHQLMQFLMGLHESFSAERSQVLMMDPLPDLEKAFSMVMSVEKQRSVHTGLAENTNNVYQLVMKENMRDHAEKPVFKRRQQQSGQGTQLNVAANQSNMSALVSELLKMVKSANTQPTDPLHVDYANYVEYNEDFADKISKMSSITGSVNSYCGRRVVLRTSWIELNPRWRSHAYRDYNLNKALVFVLILVTYLMYLVFTEEEDWLVNIECVLRPLVLPIEQKVFSSLYPKR
ncbi:UNVERIFIED_CONTAM: hypothetical protein Scaly_0900800 [Sesamum calycinum]|uniref:Retrotransposon gag domain-containing protein n=1 Tax=Sesamum calycinum TaxID=2727403 RepID=A0AAW2QWD5_9LAMI